MTARGEDDLPSHTLRVASVRNGQGAVQGYTVSSLLDPDRWPGHLAGLLAMVPGATFDAGARVWTVKARQWRWLTAALGEHRVLALDPPAARTLGLPCVEADLARSVPWPVGRDVLDVLRTLRGGASMTETPPLMESSRRRSWERCPGTVPSSVAIRIRFPGLLGEHSAVRMFTRLGGRLIHLDRHSGGAVLSRG